MTRTAEDLALYFFHGCPYCERVLRALAELDLKLELRDVRAQPDHRAELRAARGRGTVPVLRIAGPDGAVTWMPESKDIVRYLEERFGEG